MKCEIRNSSRSKLSFSNFSIKIVKAKKKIAIMNVKPNIVIKQRPEEKSLISLESDDNDGNN